EDVVSHRAELLQGIIADPLDQLLASDVLGAARLAGFHLGLADGFDRVVERIAQEKIGPAPIARVLPADRIHHVAVIEFFHSGCGGTWTFPPERATADGVRVAFGCGPASPAPTTARCVR